MYTVWIGGFDTATVGNSSVGMAKAALEVVNGVNLFGKHGAHWSVIFVDIDAHYRNRTTVDSILARESASKVVRWHISLSSAGGRGVQQLASLCLVAYFIFICHGRRHRGVCSCDCHVNVDVHVLCVTYPL